MRLLFALILFCLCLPVSAQTGPTPTHIAGEIKPLAHKTVIFVFDVTQSTRHGGVFTQERAATSTVLRLGCSPGDRVILLKFGTGYSVVFDKTLINSSDIDPLIDQIPAAPEPGHGTNIRWPHHEALKLITRDALCPAVVVLLTDSFNDRPDPTDPNYPKYLSYYTLKGLTVYPASLENSDYVRKLDRLSRKGCLHQYGVGVGIAPDGRPIERLPVGPGQGDSSAGTITEAPAILAPTELPVHASFTPWLLALAALLLLIAALWYFVSRRPLPLRLRLGDKGLPRDFRVAPGSQIALGGAPGTTPGSAEIFPLAGLAAPAAVIDNVRGRLILAPITAQAGSPNLFHNGLPLQQPVPLRVGDELRVSIPATEMEAGREHRLRVEDPQGPVF